jgi:hypothetical protein
MAVVLLCQNGCDGKMSRCLQEIAAACHCSDLEDVALAYCDNVGLTDDGVSALLSQCPSLRCFDVSGCTQLTGNDTVIDGSCLSKD